MTSKATRSALVALTVVGAGAAAGASPAFASIPTFYVNQPKVTAVKHLTPESAVLTGSIDTGGNPLTTFTLAPGGTRLWANSFIISNTTTSPATEHVDGLPASGSSAQIPTSSGSYSNGGAENHSQVVFEYDRAKDFAANGNNPGPDTGFANEVDVPTASGLSAVKAKIGAYPASSGLVTGTLPLKPGTKYVYWITQQAGATTAAASYNTYGTSSSVTTNPTYSCLPTGYAAVTSPYDTYTSTGTITGDGHTEPQIQGPCIYLFGGSALYYTSNYGTFTTPKLGFVSFQRKAMVSGHTASLKATNHSIEPARGTLVLEIRQHGKMVSVAHGAFKLHAHHAKTIDLTLTHAGMTALAKHSPLTTKVDYSSKTDQPTHSTHVTLK